MQSSPIVRHLVAVALLGGIVAASEAQEDRPDSLDRNYAEELPRIAPLSPQEALDSFEIHPDFNIELVAAEPLVHDPIAMAFDESGRMFVVEMRGYSEERDENIGAVRLLEDTNGDGVFNLSSIYVDGLAWPTAVACYDGGIFVAVPPDIIYCKDEDGDGVADTRDVVFTGFNLTNVQGLLNSFKWGLDNRIHGATSSSGGEIVSTAQPDAIPVPLRGRDFAFNPKTGVLVPESGGAQHGLSFDAVGRKFVSHNSDHIQLITYEDRYAARNPFYAPPRARKSIASDGPAADVFRISPVEPWRIVRTRLRIQGLVPGPVEGGGTAAGYFTSATGVTIYKGDAWPADYRGNAFIGDVGSNLVHRKIIEPDGVLLAAHRADADTEFLRSRDIWFRPAQFCNGPDGNLYIADMYREVIEHPDSLHPIIKQHLDLTSGNDRGRIYRIVPKGFQYTAIPDLSALSSEALVPFLAHTNAWHRETAARLLYQRQDTVVVDAVTTLAANAESPVGRIQALHTLKGLDALNTAPTFVALNDKDAWVRVHGLRLAEPLLATSVVLRAHVPARVHDASRIVRYQAAFTLGELEGPEKSSALATILRKEGNDPWIQMAVMTSAFDRPGELLVALLDYPGALIGSSRVTMVESLATQVGASGSAAEIQGVLAALTTVPELQRAVTKVVQGAQLGQRGATIQRTLADSDPAQAHLRSLVATARRDAVLEGASKKKLNAISDLAFDTFENASPILFALLDPNNQEPSEARIESLKTLRRFDDAEIGASVLRSWPSFSPQVRTVAIEVLFSRRDWVAALLQSIEQRTFNSANLDSTRVHSLTHHPDDVIRAQAEGIFAEARTASREAVVAAHQGALTLKGDPARGRTLFSENCAQCHRAGGIGYAVGPDLATVAQAGADKILTNVLDPNREINPQYTYYTVETHDWESYSGLIDSETATSITLRRANGETDTLLRTNIETITSSNLSLMPEGWEEEFDNQALADLIAFLTTLE